VSVVGWGEWIGVDPETRKRTHFARPVWYLAGDMERAVVFQPGYRTDRKTYGLHGMDITWLLRGPLGVAQFVVFTHWTPGEVGHIDWLSRKISSPMAADLGYHALCAQYDGQTPMGDCDYLDDRPCFYDGSSLQAQELFARFVIEGDAVIWRELGERHDDLLIPGGSS